MNNNISKRLKQINIENNIWILYIVIIIISIYANSLEKDYFINNNIKSKNKYRLLNTIVFITLILVYSYFELDAIDSFKDKNKSTKTRQLDTLSLIATTLVLISGIIYLYIIISDNNLEEEIAFN